MGTAPSGNAVCVSIRTTETGYADIRYSPSIANLVAHCLPPPPSPQTSKQQLIVRTSKGDDQIMAHAPNQNVYKKKLKVCKDSLTILLLLYRICGNRCGRCILIAINSTCN